jgi:GTP cyclohydrolase I
LNKRKMNQGIRMFLEGLGLDVEEDQHLKDTPRRVTRAWAEEFACGYLEDPGEVLTTAFEEECDELIIVKNIPFVSHCAHHLVEISGVAHVGYLPKKGRITGLSKLARVVDIYAHRLQVQERLTRQVAHAIQKHLDPKGVGVILSASHSCMVCRGVKKPGAVTVTSCVLGEMRKDTNLRAEFISLCQKS